ILPSTFAMRRAYGRAASADACARRSFDAATICMALVIFCVALVAAMRTRMSLRLGMGQVRRQRADDRQRIGTGSNAVSTVDYRLSGVCPPCSLGVRALR